MITPTIYSFIQALLSPADHFTTLRGARIDTDTAGHPLLNRTSRFAEAGIEWQGGRWLVCMPLTPAAVPEIERIAACLHTLRSEWLAEYRLLRNEMRFVDSTGTEHRSDLVLQQIPRGISFAEVLAEEPREKLCAALDELRDELLRLGISHNNLKAENLRWSGGRFYPIRWHFAVKGTGSDAEAFADLHRIIEQSPAPQQTVSDVQAAYGMPDKPLTGHLWVGNTFEQLILVEDETGYGYVDASNRAVIAAQYLWADDFHEGRAAVQTPTGMGLIDKQGRYVIEPRFEIVDYDSATGLTHVRQNGLWSDYDYEGHPLGSARNDADSAAVR